MIFIAASAPTANLSDQGIEHVNAGSATASYKLNNDGTVRNHLNTVLETWLGAGSAGDYEARATQTSGSTDSGTMGSWISLGTSRTWSDTATIGTIDGSSFTIEIRDASTLIVLDSAAISLTADAS